MPHQRAADFAAVQDYADCEGAEAGECAHFAAQARPHAEHRLAGQVVLGPRPGVAPVEVPVLVEVRLDFQVARADGVDPMRQLRPATGKMSSSRSAGCRCARRRARDADVDPWWAS